MHPVDTVPQVQQVLEDAFMFFQKGVSSAAPLSVGQVEELLDVVTAIVQSAASGDEGQVTSAAMLSSGLLTVLCNLAAQPLVFSPEVSAGFSLQQAFVQLKIKALQCVNSVVVFACDMALQEKLGDILEQSSFVSALLSILSSPATFEVLRSATAETLFVILLRVSTARKAVVAKTHSQAILNCLVLEPSPTVRASICCSLKELASSNPHEIFVAGAFPVLSKTLCVDDNADARALAAEILEKIVVAEGSLVSQPLDLVTAIKEKLERETAEPVVQAVARLLETACGCANTKKDCAFWDTLVSQQLMRPLILALKHPYSASASIARALRVLVQLAPPHLNVGHLIVSHFPSLSTLLKAVMDASNLVSQRQDLPLQVLCVELGIGVSILLCQSPMCRQMVHRELHTFPLWTNSLKSALLGFLNMAALDYFNGIELIDVTGSHLNNLQGIEWNDNNRPKKSAIRGLFSVQEQRVKEQRFDRVPVIGQATMEVEIRRKMRLTFIILSFAVHLALSLQDAGPAEPSQSGKRTEMLQSPGTVLSERAASAPTDTPRMQTSEPMFPNPSSPRILDMMRKRPLTQKEKEEMAIAYDKFDSAFKLTIQFAEHYAKKDRDEEVYRPTPDGFVVRQEKLRNPWGRIVKKQRLKSWSVRDLKEGDLFYFAIPFDELRSFAVDSVLEKARRHLAQVKKMFITTPQVAKGRRWFLYDMINNVMPAIINVLAELQLLVNNHGGDNVRFPLFLFREKEMHLGERALHTGNLVEIVEQVKFYFSQNPAELLGVNAGYVQHIEERIKALAQQNFSGEEHVSPPRSDEGNGEGHGGISSDSDA